jgi:hypothetical protein
MLFLRLRVGLRFGGSDAAPAFNDAGADTARLDDSVEPASRQACIRQACIRQARGFVRRASKFSVGFSLAPAGLKKTKDQQRTFHLVSTLIMHSARKRNNFRRRRDDVEQ